MAYKLQKSPGHLLRRAHQFAQDLYSREVGSRGPTPRQFEVLHAVAANEGMSQTDLVRATGIDRSTLADMIARMIKKGLLSRSRTTEDARANVVSITAAGRRMLNSTLNSVAKAENAALAVLPKTQQADFMKALFAYAEALDKMEAASRKLAAKKKAPAKRKAPTKRKAATKKKTSAKRTAKKKVASGDGRGSSGARLRHSRSAKTVRRSGSGGSGPGQSSNLPEVELIDVHYATCRATIKNPTNNKRYGEQRRKNGTLEYGVVTVTVPPDRHRGDLPLPTWWQKALGLVDEQKHFTIRDLNAFKRTAQLWQRLKAAAEQTSATALLFVHGFNTPFSKAAMTAAQLSYDISFNGVTALYAWPSKTSVSERNYLRARANAEVSAAGLQQFLLELCKNDALEKIHLVAHSMGGYVTLNALAKYIGPKSSFSKLGQVVLAAPDIDSDQFLAEYEALIRLANRSTLYTSRKDKAMQASHFIQGYRRAGWADPVIVVDGLDSVDASPVDMPSLLGHGYFSESSTVRTDLHNTLDGVKPGVGGRKVLESATNVNGQYWRLPKERRA